MARFRPSKAIRSAVFVLVLAALVAGCGRRGRLEPPPDPNAPAKADPDKPDTNKAGFKRRPPNPPIRPPTTPFLLDPLLK